jgi:hypothetical protein
VSPLCRLWRISQQQTRIPAGLDGAAQKSQ